MELTPCIHRIHMSGNIYCKILNKVGKFPIVSVVQCVQCIARWVNQQPPSITEIDVVLGTSKLTQKKDVGELHREQVERLKEMLKNVAPQKCCGGK